MKENLKPHAYKQQELNHPTRVSRVGDADSDCVLFVERTGERRIVARLRGESSGAEGKPSLKRAEVTIRRPETVRATHGQGEAGVRPRGGPNHVVIEKTWDELWVGEKFQASTEIAGSPRNSIRDSLSGKLWRYSTEWGRGVKATEPYQTTNAITEVAGSKTTSAKIRGQEGKSPDHQLRSRRDS